MQMLIKTHLVWNRDYLRHRTSQSWCCVSRSSHLRVRDKMKTQTTRIQGRPWLGALKSKIEWVRIPLVEGDKNPTQTSLSVRVTDWLSESKNEPQGLGLETSCYWVAQALSLSRFCQWPQIFAWLHPFCSNTVRIPPCYRNYGYN